MNEELKKFYEEKEDLINANSTNEALQNAHNKNEQFILVPKVINK